MNFMHLAPAQHSSPRFTLSSFQWLTVAVLMLLASVASTRVQLFLLDHSHGGGAIFPPAGIALALLLLVGRPAWPLLVLAPVAGLLIAGASPLVIVLAGAGRILQPAVGTLLLRRPFQFDGSVRSLRDVIALIVSAAIGGLVSSLLGAYGLCLAGTMPWDRFESVFQGWMIADILGVLVFTPSILFVANDRHLPEHWPTSRKIEALAFWIVACFACAAIFVYPGVKFPYPTFIIIAAAAIRFGLSGVSVSVFTICAFSLWSALARSGPFSNLTLERDLFHVMGFSTTAAVAGLFLAAFIIDRKRAAENASRLASIVSSSTDAIISKDRNGIVTSWNAGAERIFGFSAAEMIGESVRKIIPDEKTAEESEILSCICRNERIEQFETLRRRKDGSLVEVSITVSPIVDIRGVVVGISKIARDITERRIRERKLLESERQMQLSLDASKIGTWSWVLATGQHHWDERMFAIFGMDPNDPVDRMEKFLNAIHPDDRERIKGDVDRAIRLESGYDTEYRIVLPNGAIRHIAARGRVLTASDGTAEKMTGICQDCTDRKLAEQQIRDNERRFRSFVSAAPFAAYETDAQGECLFVNSRWADMTGRTPEMGLGSNWLEAVHPDDRETVMDSWRKSVAQAREFSHEYRYLRPDGEICWITGKAVAVRDEKGVVTGYVGYSSDITERKQFEEALRESENRFRLAIEHAPIGISLVAMDGKWLKVNHELCRIVGYSEEELQQLDFQTITHPDDLAADLVLIDRLVRGDISSYKMEKRYIHKSGEPVWVQLSVSLVADAADNPLYFIAQVEDVTERRRVEAERREYVRKIEAANMRIEVQSKTLRRQAVELETASRDAQAASLAKSLFLANMSHEIRTPMTAILGFTDVLLDEACANNWPAARVDDLRTVKRNAEHLLNIINDILDLSKIEAGKMTVESIPVDPVELLNEVLALMRIRAEAKSLQLVGEVGAPMAKSVVTDPTRVRQILINLIGNAIKFTEVGSVCVRLRYDGVAPGQAYLCFDVVDTGIGMTPQHRESLFEAFMQADASFTRKFGGTGLGLAVCRRLAQKLGGDVEVESVLGKGSTFSFRVRCGSDADAIVMRDPSTDAAPKSEAAAVATEDEPLAARILLVEDGPDNQRLIAFHLRKAGIAVTIANNGQEGLESAIAAEEGGAPFDLILMDLQMPVMDGYAATRQLRERGMTRPIIALTAHAMAGEAERCTATGFDDFATKPIHRDSLIAMLRRHLAASSLPAETPIV